MRSTLLVLGLAAALVLVSCGGSSKPADPIGLSVAILDGSPEDQLPKGTKLDSDLDYVAGFDFEDAVASFYLPLTGKGTFADAYIYVFRTEDDAQSGLDDVTEDYEDFDIEVPKDKSAVRCAWDDELEEAACFGRIGLALVETFTYLDDDPDLDEDDAEAAGLAAAKSLIEYAHGLAGSAKKLDKAPLKAMAALMASTQPPNAPDGVAMQSPTILGDEDDALVAQYDRVHQVRWATGTGWTLYLIVFANKSDASSYRDEYLGGLNSANVESDGSSCKRSGDGQYWVCVAVTNEVVSLVVHRNQESEIDRGAAKYASDGADYAKTLRSGELPRKPRASKVPSGSATVPNTPVAVRTTVRTPTPPNLSAINAGTWTFQMKVLSNTCAGNDPAPGQIVTLEYEFTESGGDDLIGAGELFQVDQTLPGARKFGLFTMALPKLNLQLPVGSGSGAGTGKLTLEFGAVDTAAATYAEEYADCKITAITN